jgi:CBS domain containing-hemolysin-like protein
MLTLLIIVVVVSIAVSALCSVMEAALFAVPLAHAKYLADKGSRAGKILLSFKEEIGRPVSAILILNTVSHTVGAAVAGALVAKIFVDDPEQAVLIFSIVFTLLMLYLSEIIPKQLGALFGRSISVLIAMPLQILIKLLYPAIILTEGVSKLFRRNGGEPGIAVQDFVSMADIGTEEGVLDHLQGSVIRNVIGLDRLLVKDILTPRVVVFRLPENQSVGNLRGDILEWNFTRVPVFDPNDGENVTGYVMQRDVFRALLKGEDDQPLSEFARPLTTIPELMRVDQLLLQMFEGEAICSVVDEHAGFAGIVTLEDIIEEIVGREIVDEYDLVSDLRSYAQILFKKKRRERQQGS